VDEECDRECCHGDHSSAQSCRVGQIVLINGAQEEAEVGHGGDDRSGSATVCLVHVAGHDSEQHRPVADPPRCQQTVVETCVPTLVSSSRLWTGQKIDHPVRVVNASRAASPAVEFPDGPSAGLHTQIVQRSGMTARMPPPTPLFAGNPTR
jgi:hypothetical protein